MTNNSGTLCISEELLLSHCAWLKMVVTLFCPFPTYIHPPVCYLESVNSNKSLNLLRVFKLGLLSDLTPVFSVGHGVIGVDLRRGGQVHGGAQDERRRRRLHTHSQVN